MRRAFVQALAALALFCSSASAGETQVRMEVVPGAAPRVAVEMSESSGDRRWSFVDTHGAAVDLRRRISDFVAFDARGAQVPVSRSEGGDYEAATACAAIRYTVALDPPRDPASVANISWLTGERGVLMLYDLLPRSATRARLRIDAPDGWRQFTTENKRNGFFDIEATDDAVFAVGRDLREHTKRIGDVELVFIAQGAWAFADDDDALAALAQVYEAHRKVLRDVPRERVLVSLGAFPYPVPADVWRAETRGATLNLFAGRLPSRSLALTRFTLAASHELLHLWVPNSLALDGAYDWFYEGFVEYEALRACVRLGVISYQDMLDAIGRAYDRYSAAYTAGDAPSLLAASRERSATADAAIYSNGLITAFLYDLTLRSATGNDRSLDDVFRELLRKYARGGARRDGNSAVIAALDRALGSTEFTRRFVLAQHKLDLDAEARRFGLRVSRTGTVTRLNVAAESTERQQALHRELGRTY